MVVDRRQRPTRLLRRGRELADELGLTALRRQLATAPDEWALLRDGDGWLLRAGPEYARLADSRGVRQLRTLLSTVSASDLEVVERSLTILRDATARRRASTESAASPTNVPSTPTSAQGSHE